MTTDDDRACLYYKLTNEPKGSSELKSNCFMLSQSLKFLRYMYVKKKILYGQYSTCPFNMPNDIPRVAS